MSHVTLAAGELDRRVTLEQAAITRDPSFGGEQPVWSTLATVWAKVVEGPRAEDASAQLRLAARRATFTVRYRSDITAKMRIGYAGQKFRIVGDPAELGRKVGLVIEAEAFSV